jgi:Domain of unknown function (DUF4336)
MTAVRLNSGSLWVHAPIAATKECIKLVSELGNVEHIVLPTTGTAAKTLQYIILSDTRLHLCIIVQNS